MKAVTTSKIETVFSVGSVQNVYREESNNSFRAVTSPSKAGGVRPEEFLILSFKIY
jgi:hypothetical protein